MFLTMIILFFVLPALNAPTWCFVLAWITFAGHIISIIAKVVSSQC